VLGSPGLISSTGNTVIGTKGLSAQNGAGIDVRVAAQVVIVNNIVQRSHAAGITASNLADVTIADNRTERNGRGWVNATSADANHHSNTAPSEIYDSNSEFHPTTVTITGNAITCGNGPAGVWRGGIRLGQDATPTTTGERHTFVNVSGNTISGQYARSLATQATHPTPVVDMYDEGISIRLQSYGAVSGSIVRGFQRGVAIHAVAGAKQVSALKFNNRNSHAIVIGGSPTNSGDWTYPAFHAGPFADPALANYTWNCPVPFVDFRP
jgi:hypothetical protein